MKRRLVQVVTALIANGYLPGFLNGTIYQGPWKRACLPFLNCYSCPGALGACPVGAMQSLAVSSQSLSLYVGGALLATGALVGRLVCGWLCPFGLLQDLMAKLQRCKIHIPLAMLKVKYVVMLLTLLLPLLWVNPVTGLSAPYFCMYICPAGTLEAGLPLLLLNPPLRELAGSLFLWKVGLLLVILVAMVFVWRPFCRVLCPLGAFYGLCNRLSFYQLQINQDNCSSCGQCGQACPAGLPVWEEPRSSECIRCLQCIDTCHRRAISWGPVSVKTGRDISGEARL
ncbi:MAG: 4Fe-4S binding protein [Clostridia bacterium]|nr:4Fe-4S binding protein [Clostridia bacterium]